MYSPASNFFLPSEVLSGNVSGCVLMSASFNFFFKNPDEAWRLEEHFLPSRYKQRHNTGVHQVNNSSNVIYCISYVDHSGSVHQVKCFRWFLTFRWYSMMPVLRRSSSMPMRWGSSESNTTPIPSFLRARVSSCRHHRSETGLLPDKFSHTNTLLWYFAA